MAGDVNSHCLKLSIEGVRRESSSPYHIGLLAGIVLKGTLCAQYVMEVHTEEPTCPTLSQYSQRGATCILQLISHYWSDVSYAQNKPLRLGSHMSSCGLQSGAVLLIGSGAVFSLEMAPKPDPKLHRTLFINRSRSPQTCVNWLHWKMAPFTCYANRMLLKMHLIGICVNRAEEDVRPATDCTERRQLWLDFSAESTGIHCLKVDSE